MADITAFAYTIKTNKKMEDSRKIVTARITAGNGSLTYPSNGIPLSAASLGFASGQIDSVSAVDENANGSADGLTHKWDNTRNTIRVYSGATEQTGGSSTTQVDIIIQAIGY